MIAQREIWWADLGEPVGSAPGYRRPVLVLQSDRFNRSLLGTVLCVTLTGSTRLANSPGNVLLKARESGLARDSVVTVTQLQTLDRSQLLEWAGRVSDHQFDQVLAGIDLVLGR